MMKGIIKKTFILLAAFVSFTLFGLRVSAAPVAGDTGTYDGFDYEVNDDATSVTLTGMNESVPIIAGQILELPDSITTADGDELTVTSIGNNAFRVTDDKNSGFKWTGLKLPKNLKTVGICSFAGNKFMTGELLIPNSVTSIDQSAFTSCESFDKLTLSTSLVSIGRGAFEYCTGLCGELRLPGSLKTIGGEAFYNCYNFTGTLKIPDSVTTIEYRAFEGCTGFSGDLKIPVSVTKIDTYAFANMILDGELQLPASLDTIGNYAFTDNFFSSVVNNSDKLKLGHIFGGVPSDSFYTYQRISDLQVVSLSGENFAFGEGTYTRCLNTKDSFCKDANGFIYKIEDEKATIYFYDNIDSQGLVIPAELDGKPVVKIGKYAFADCSGFTGTLQLPDSLTQIDDYAFYRCSGFAGDISIPNGTTTIGAYAFYECTGFDGQLVLGENIEMLDSYCFANCLGLTGDISIPSGCYVSNSVFKNCENLSGVLTIPSVISYIDTWTFYGSSFGKIINNSTKTFDVDSILKTVAESFYFNDANGEKVDTIGQGSYTLRRSITDAVISFKKGTTYTYEGEEIKPEIEVNIGTLLLREGEDYTIVYKNNNAIGTATVEVTGIDRYFDLISAEYTIAATTEVAAIDPIPDQVYTGKAYYPEITFGGVKLNKGTDYKIIYQNNINAGTAVITAIGKGTYTFVLGTTFNILPASVSEAAVSDIAPQAYTGDEIKPDMEITVSGNKLVAEKDYTLTYKDNIDKETATVTATGKGNYTGSVSREFKITGIPDKKDTDENNDPKDQNTPDPADDPSVEVPDASDNAIYMVKGQKLTLPEGTWEIKDNANKTVNLKKGVLAAKRVGTAKIASGTQEIAVKVIQPKFAEKSWTEEAGREITLALDGFDKEHYSILWSSSDVDVATVSSDGIVRTQAKGTATITAYVNGKTYSCKLKVIESTIAAERTLHIAAGTTATLKIPGVKDPVWEEASGNAVLQGKNKVKAKTPGTSKFIAKTPDGKSYVVYVIAEDIAITAPGMEAKGKNKYSLQLAPKEAARISFKGVDRQIIWKSTSPETAYVDEDGTVHALKEGKCKFMTKVNGKTLIMINVAVK